MVKTIVVAKTGGPEVLELKDVEIGQPGQGEVLVRHTAIGLNFIDVYFRSGLYPAPAGVPFTPGNEGCGVVEALGKGVDGFAEGDRVAYVGPLGSYSEKRLIAADRLVRVPDTIDDETAGTMMLKGMTAEYLLNRTFAVHKGQTILFHAAAGGVGLIAGQWAKSIGARVIGTAGSPEKIELAKANGYDEMIDYRTENFVERVKDLTDGAGVDVVYDSVGKDTFPGSLDCLKPRGMWVSFGQSSGALPPVDLAILSQKGSLFATRPSLFAYIATKKDLDASANALFAKVASGDISIAVQQRYSLAEASQAHSDLEARKTIGTTVLLP